MTDVYDVPPNDKFEVLRDFALERSKQNEERAKALNRTLIVCGSKQSGKTTLLNNLLDKNVQARPTLAVEYSFGRKINKDGVKDTCNFWEVAGGVKFSALIPQLIITPLKERRCIPSIAIVVDLTQPTFIYNTLDKFIKVTRECMRKYGDENPDHFQIICEKHKADWMAIHPNHPDADAIDLPYLKLYILGAKYDEFQNFDPEKKKIICRFLRSYALSCGASLYFVSTVENYLLKRGKEVLHHAGFDLSAPGPISTDYNTALSIPAGFDNLADIGTANMGRNFSSLQRELENWFSGHFPQKEEDRLEPEDPSSHSSFKESQLDSILQRKKRSPFL